MKLAEQDAVLSGDYRKAYEIAAAERDYLRTATLDEWYLPYRRAREEAEDLRDRLMEAAGTGMVLCFALQHRLTVPEARAQIAAHREEPPY